MRFRIGQAVTWMAVLSFVWHTNAAETGEWNQWRGPWRNSQIGGPAWPSGLTAGSLQEAWSVPLGPSYSGPVVTGSTVIVTETRNKQSEVVYGFDAHTGNQKWRAEWPGSMKVPFFAAKNGSWIRSTPATDGETVFIAGMRDVLVALDVENGEERWRIDFIEQLKTSMPSFGCVSSPLIWNDLVVMQAGGGVTAIEKATGKIRWRSMPSGNGMSGGAFSSPIITTLYGEEQLVVQSREELAGLNPTTGKVLWSEKIPAFRGMNILTPMPYGNAIFTSTYGGKAWLYDIIKTADGGFSVQQRWQNKVQGYMSSPVVVGEHVYLHLRNRRFICIHLETGKETFTTKPFGEYWSMIARDDKILALDEKGELLLIEANPKAFTLIDRVKVSDQPAWAHLAKNGGDLFIRDMNSLRRFQWGTPTSAQ